MNDHNVRCRDERLLELLHSDQDGDDVCDAAAHLAHCPRCQERLEALSAQPQDWQLAQECLSFDDAVDSHDHDDDPRSAWATLRWQRVPSGWSESMAKQLLAPPSHPEMLGRIGRYEVERVIGSGGMGVVFKAFDTELNRPVAVKVLAPYLAGSGAARKRFAREARAAAAIVHEHVVAIHNVETEGDSPFLVMHYVAGESLQQRLDREGWLELCAILRIGSQTAAGLAAAHAQGLVHRDVKPSNILLEQGIERTLLTDFGLARASDDASITFTGYHPGTPQYMSPEQARGEAITVRSDLFSLGSVLYAMCTGRAPFRAETTYGILRRITDSEPRPIHEINPEIPEWLCAIIAKLMSKQESGRYQSAMEVAELLAECLAHVQQPATVALPKSVASVVANRKPRPPLVRFVVAAAFASSLIYAGVLIVLELNKGQLTIQCEADDVPIRIMQGGDVVETLSVSKAGKTVRIAAGHYQVEVDGNIDRISVDGGAVSLQRGGVETVRIVRSTDAPDSGEPQNSVALAARKLTADLWNAQLQRARLLETHGAAHPEVVKLDAAIKAIEESIQRLPGASQTIESLSARKRKLVAELRNAQLRRTRLLETHGAAHPEVLKLDAEIKAIEESIQRLQAASANGQDAGEEKVPAIEDLLDRKNASSAVEGLVAGPASATSIRIAGKCVDEKGMPVAGATIDLYSIANSSQSLKTTQTRPDGVFELGEFPDPQLIAGSSTSYKVVGRKEGKAIGIAAVLSPLQKSDALELELDVAAQLKGIVTGPDGSPLRNARVRVASYPWIDGVHGAITNEAGEYVLERIPSLKHPGFGRSPGSLELVPVAGKYLLVEHPDLGTIQPMFAACPDTIDVQYDAPAKIAGRVVDEDGKPLAGITVIGRPSRSPVHRDEFIRKVKTWHNQGTATTDAEGRYSLLLQYSGTVEVDLIDQQHFAKTVSDVVVRSGEVVTLPDIVTVGPAFVSGRIADVETGNTVACPQGVRLRVYVMGQGSLTGILVRPDGTYRLPVLPGTSYVYFSSNSLDELTKIWDVLEHPHALNAKDYPVTVAGSRTVEVDFPVQLNQAKLGKDLQSLQGEWELQRGTYVAFGNARLPLTADQLVDGNQRPLRFSIRGNQRIGVGDAQFSSAPEPGIVFALGEGIADVTVDAGRSPPALCLTWIINDKRIVHRFLYRIDGDQLELACHSNNWEVLPDSLEPHSDAFMLVAKRVATANAERKTSSDSKQEGRVEDKE